MHAKDDTDVTWSPGYDCRDGGYAGYLYTRFGIYYKTQSGNAGQWCDVNPDNTYYFICEAEI